MNTTKKLIESAEHWERIAREAGDLAAWNRARGLDLSAPGQSAGDHQARSYRATATALRSEAVTGIPHCNCHNTPIADCLTRKGRAPVTMEEHRAAGHIVIRYVVTHIGRSYGMRTLTFPCQGRNTFATYKEAQTFCDELIKDNTSEQLANCYGAQAPGTFEVRACECWAGHFDPCGIWFD